MALLLSCNKDNDMDQDVTEDPSRDAIEASVVDFQWTIFRESIRAQADGTKNMALSPASIVSALYMTLSGADGATKTGIEQALSLNGLEIEALGPAYEKWCKLLTDTENNTRLSLANAVFWDKNRISPHQDFLAFVDENFHAQTDALDFASEEAVQAINEWVDDKTDGRILKIFDQIGDEEVMFLLDALFFTGDWLYPFPLNGTSDRPFTKSDGSDIDVPTMHQDISTIGYVQTEAYEAVELLFDDTTYSLTLVLPPPSEELDNFIKKMNPGKFDQILDQLKPGRMLLNVPSFGFAFKMALNEPLKAMGMGIAFDPNAADFSKLGTALEGNLFLSRVLHKSFLSIDEKGAEGAAVTSVGVGVTSLPPTLSFDRPFMFVLRERTTESILFLGKIEDPTQE